MKNLDKPKSDIIYIPEDKKLQEEEIFRIREATRGSAKFIPQGLVSNPEFLRMLMSEETYAGKTLPQALAQFTKELFTEFFETTKDMEKGDADK